MPAARADSDLSFVPGFGKRASRIRTDSGVFVALGGRAPGGSEAPHGNRGPRNEQGFFESRVSSGGWVSASGGRPGERPGGPPSGEAGLRGRGITKRTPEHRGNQAQARSSGKQSMPGNMSVLCFLFRNLFPKCCGATFRFRRGTNDTEVMLLGAALRNNPWVTSGSSVLGDEMNEHHFLRHEREDDHCEEPPANRTSERKVPTASA